MIILEEYIEELHKIVKNNPESLKYPVGYAVDDEGNEYQAVRNYPTLCQIHSVAAPWWEMVGFQREENIADADLNVVLLN